METSIHYRSFQQKCYQKDASFSSYLRPQPPPPPPPPPKSPPPPSQEPNESTVDDSDQISVFDAENYFSESSSNNNNNEHKEVNKIASSSSSLAIFPPDQRSEFSIVSRLSSVSSDDRYRNGRNYRTHSFHATPTASSEASWNSRTGLLSNPPGSIAVSLKNLPTRDNLNINGERFSSAKKWFLGRKCPCSCKKSVEVKEKSSIVKTSESKKLQSNQSVIESEFKTVFTKQQSVKKSHLVESSEMLVPNLRRVSSQKCSMNDVIESSEKVDPNSRRFSSQGQFSANATVENRHHHHHHGRQFNEGAGFSFPILNQSSKIMLTGAQTCTPMEDPLRDSLEVFQPLEDSASGKSMAVQHRALAAHGGDFAFPASPISRITAATDDDVASDASSDLFEIESLSTQTPLPPPPSYPMFLRRDSLDEAATFNARRLAAGGGVNFRRRSSEEAAATPSIAVAECYEPSEASIDWSVTTAEAFDRASVTNLSISASDIEEFATIQQVKSGGGGDSGGDGSRRRLGNYGGLLSCRCEKAVSVGLPPRF